MIGRHRTGTSCRRHPLETRNPVPVEQVAGSAAARLVSGHELLPSAPEVELEIEHGLVETVEMLASFLKICDWPKVPACVSKPQSTIAKLR